MKELAQDHGDSSSSAFSCALSPCLSQRIPSAVVTCMKQREKKVLALSSLLEQWMESHTDNTHTSPHIPYVEETCARQTHGGHTHWYKRKTVQLILKSILFVLGHVQGRERGLVRSKLWYDWKDHWGLVRVER